MDRKNAIQTKRNELEYLSQQLNNIKSANDAVPIIQQRCEALSWQIKTYSGLPGHLPWNEIGAQAQSDLNLATGTVPPVPSFKPVQLAQWSAYTTSGSNAAMSFTLQAASDPQSPVQTFAQQQASEYRELQKRQNRELEVKRQLESFGQRGILDRFDQAVSAARRYEAGTEDIVSAANAMRNVLYAFKGEVWDRFRFQPKESEPGTGLWLVEVSKRYRGAAGQQGTKVLCKQQEMFSELNDRLSQTLKARNQQMGLDLRDTWTQLIDHMYSVLGYVVPR